MVSLKLQTSLKVSLFIGAILKCELSAGRKSIETCLEKNDILKMLETFSRRDKSRINIRTHCAIINVLKFRKLVDFESSYIVISFSYIYAIIDGKR